MTKFFTKLLLALVASLLILGCSVKESDTVGMSVLTARLEPSDTRVSFDDVQGKLSWTPGDEIAVHVGGAYVTATVNPENGHLSVAETSSSYRNYYAVYPASVADAGNYGNPTLKVKLPSSYDISDIVSGASTARTADFSPCPMVAVNDTDDSMLRFYHVGGLLRITIPGINPAMQKVRVTFDKDVTGEYTVSAPGSDAPTITTAGASSNNIVTFTVAENALGEALASGSIVLNIPVPCGTYESVMVETLDSSGAVLGFKTYTGDPLIFARHHGKKLGFSELQFYDMDSLEDVTVTGEYVLDDNDFTRIINTEKDFVDGWDGDDRDDRKTPWKAYYVDGSNPQPAKGTIVTGNTAFETDPPDWLKVLSDSGEGDGKDNAFKFTMIGAKPEGAEMLPGPGAQQMINKLKNTNLGDVDLSRWRWDGDSGSYAFDPDAPWETANCYVINGYGSFNIPLIYGNAIKGGTLNTSAYRPADTFNIPVSALGTFINAKGNAISSQFILSDNGITSVTGVNGCVLWQDTQKGFEIVKEGSIELASRPFEGTGGIKSWHLKFSIAKDDIKPGNVILALRDKDNNILWSWHIWVRTNISNETLQVYNIKCWSGNDSQYQDYGLLSEPLGWVPPISYKGGDATARSLWVAIVSTETNAVLGSFEVSSSDYHQSDIDYASDGIYSALYYQWGRKDPFLATSGVAKNKVYTSDKYKDYVVPETERQNENIRLFHEAFPEGTAALAKMIKEPYNFNSSQSYSPYINLWDGDNDSYNVDSPVVKTIYDPCPRGFTVPRLYALTGVIKTGLMATGNDDVYGTRVAASGELPSGIKVTNDHTNNSSSKKVFIPALGWRAAQTGRVNYAYNTEDGPHGYYWLSLPSDSRRQEYPDWPTSRVFHFYYQSSNNLNHFISVGSDWNTDGFPIMPGREQ